MSKGWRIPHLKRAVPQFDIAQFCPRQSRLHTLVPLTIFLDGHDLPDPPPKEQCRTAGTPFKHLHVGLEVAGEEINAIPGDPRELEFNRRATRKRTKPQIPREQAGPRDEVRPKPDDLGERGAMHRGVFTILFALGLWSLRSTLRPWQARRSGVDRSHQDSVAPRCHSRKLWPLARPVRPPHDATPDYPWQ